MFLNASFSICSAFLVLALSLYSLLSIHQAIKPVFLCNIKYPLWLSQPPDGSCIPQWGKYSLEILCIFSSLPLPFRKNCYKFSQICSQCPLMFLFKSLLSDEGHQTTTLSAILSAWEVVTESWRDNWDGWKKRCIQRWWVNGCCLWAIGYAHHSLTLMFKHTSDFRPEIPEVWTVRFGTVWKFESDVVYPGYPLAIDTSLGMVHKCSQDNIFIWGHLV